MAKKPAKPYVAGTGKGRGGWRGGGRKKKIEGASQVTLTLDPHGVAVLGECARRNGVSVSHAARFLLGKFEIE